MLLTNNNICTLIDVICFFFFTILCIVYNKIIWENVFFLFSEIFKQEYIKNNVTLNLQRVEKNMRWIFEELWYA